MMFDEVREGDTVRTREVFEDGTVFETEFTVERVNRFGDYFDNGYVSVHEEVLGRKSLSIELVHRKPKVGDLLTGAQVQRLPNHAVFLDVWNKPRTVFDGKSYGPGLTVAAALDLHDLRDPGYRLIYLPDEEN